MARWSRRDQAPRTPGRLGETAATTPEGVGEPKRKFRKRSWLLTDILMEEEIDQTFLSFIHLLPNHARHRDNCANQLHMMLADRGRVKRNAGMIKSERGSREHEPSWTRGKRTSGVWDWDGPNHCSRLDAPLSLGLGPPGVARSFGGDQEML
jgi:hypothetical protein